MYFVLNNSYSRTSEADLNTNVKATCYGTYYVQWNSHTYIYDTVGALSKLDGNLPEHATTNKHIGTKKAIIAI